MSTFQLTLTGIFIFALVIGVLVFAGILPGFRPPNGGSGGTVVLWGTVPQDTFDLAFDSFRQAHRGEFTLTYVAQNPDTFDVTLVDALAAGTGPDLVLLPHTSLVRELNKIKPISYQSFSQRTFQDSFIPEGELYLSSEGITALPVVVDPLVMYVNTDLMISGRLPLPPKSWTELQTNIKNLTLADTQGTVNQSAIAIGQFNNITHAKDIFSLLLLQSGNPIVTQNSSGFSSALQDTLGGGRPPALDAIAFFNRFANPTDPAYSWNSALPEAREFFVRGKLAFYLGYASERGRIRQQNPQLNFDAAVVPQATGKANLTLGKLYGVSITKSSRNPGTALTVAKLLAAKEGAAKVAEAASLPAARRDLLGDVSTDPIATVFNQSALLSVGWLDPEPTATGAIFKNLIESIAIRQVRPEAALSQADEQLNNLFGR